MRVRPDLRENDRSSTGYLDHDAFERQVYRFFAFPEQSLKGWESAIDAQQRTVGAVNAAYAELGSALPLVFTGHGGVGTLLKCHLGDRPISHSEDQRTVANPGGGNIFAFELEQNRLLCDWTPFENWKGPHHARR